MPTLYTFRLSQLTHNWAVNKYKNISQTIEYPEKNITVEITKKPQQMLRL
ncbi:protein of unknown function [Chryseobacterium sp. JV274]|nr:protein of unknown function [Chryseobacterium sp. JV274]